MPYKDPEVAKQKAREYRLRNLPAFNARTKKCKEPKYKLVREYKLERGCGVCGYNRCESSLDFHHLDPSIKDSGVAVLVATGKSEDVIKEEMSKCIVLCRNCHSELHAGFNLFPLPKEAYA